jgi:hypothetical protein
MWAYIRYYYCAADTAAAKPRHSNGGANHYYILAIVFFILGLMSKPMLVTLPFVLLGLDIWPLERKMSYKLLVEKIPFFICSLIDCIITLIVQHKSGATTAIKALNFHTKLDNAIISYVTYITKMIWPSRLAIFYPHPGSELPTIKVIICALLLVLISTGFVYLARRRKFFAVGWLWYLGALVPVIGIVQSGGQAMADRYTYMTFTGLFIIIAWSTKEFVPRQRYRLLSLLAVVILAGWGITACRQLRYWKNSQTLFEHTLAVTKNNYIIHTNYIVYLNEAGRVDDVIKQCYELLKIRPYSAETHNNLGIALAGTGKTQEAMEHFRLAIEYEPNYLLSYFNLALALQDQGKLEEAVFYYKQAIKIKPDYINAHLSLATALIEFGRPSEAIESCNKVLELEPNNTMARQLLENTLKKQKTP